MACPKRIIEICLNEKGFYTPRISEPYECVDCGLCIEVCSYSHEGLAVSDKNIRAYAAWSKDEKVRQSCSSGGVGYEIARTLIKAGYSFCGVRYNNIQNRAEHYIAENESELIPSIGSKYIQSYTVDGFRSIDKKKRYLITGTPCQIDSFRRYIRKYRCEDNFVLMDFFCHGVPSMFAWTKYTETVRNKTGQIEEVSWRNKTSVKEGTGSKEFIEKIDWHDSYNMKIKGGRGTYMCRLSQGDPFLRLFLSDACLGKACYDKCKFKYDNSSADIRIGDLWGETFADNKDGVSAVVSFTDKGGATLDLCNCEKLEYPFEIVAEGQMKTSPKRPWYMKYLMAELSDSDSPLEDVISLLNRYSFINLQIYRIRHPLRTIKNLIKKLIK